MEEEQGEAGCERSQVGRGRHAKGSYGLVNPKDDNMLFVAGNAGALAWRVAWRTGVWTEAFGKDTKDNTSPHGDCRNYYWEPTTSSVILLNDGSAHMRTMPTKRAARGIASPKHGRHGIYLRRVRANNEIMGCRRAG